MGGDTVDVHLRGGRGEKGRQGRPLGLVECSKFGCDNAEEGTRMSRCEPK